MAGITPCHFLRQSSSGSLSSPPTPPCDQLEDNEDDFNPLQKEELKQLVRNLRRGLGTTKSQLTNYTSVTDNLADKRSLLVEALSLADTLLAIHNSEDIQQMSVSCTAKSHRLGGEAEPNAAPSVTRLAVFRLDLAGFS